MGKTALYVILGIAIGAVIGFFVMVYFLRPSPPTYNAGVLPQVMPQAVPQAVLANPATA